MQKALGALKPASKLSSGEIVFAPERLGRSDVKLGVPALVVGVPLTVKSVQWVL